MMQVARSSDSVMEEYSDTGDGHLHCKICEATVYVYSPVGVPRFISQSVAIDAHRHKNQDRAEAQGDLFEAKGGE